MRKEISLKADGLSLPGEVYFPEGTAPPYPALCLCHGIPAGTPQDPADSGYPGLAQRFSAAGLLTLIFNFRGCGGAEGNIDMLGWTRDLKAALDYLAGLDRVDISRLFLLGSSGGAAISVYVAASDPRVAGVVTFACPAEFGFLTNGERAKALVERFRTIGLIKDADFPPSLDEWLGGFREVSPIRFVDKISPRPLLLIHGEKDDLVPVEHATRLYQSADEPKELLLLPDAGHRLRFDERAITAALDWLLQQSRPGK
jgi:dipeptidyl aminopeptidase/acylaminoacyl peptidase